MKAFFEYIKARITADVPDIKTVRMWNNQFLHSNEKSERADKLASGRTGYRNEKAFPYPACFVEFIVNEIHSRCLGIKDYDLTVRFRFGIEAYKFERLDTFDFCDTFSGAIQLMAPTEESELRFTTFQESNTEFDEDFNNVEVPYIDYRTQFRSTAAYKLKNDIIADNIDPVELGIVTDSVEPNEEVLMYEPSENKPLHFYEPIENSPVYFDEE